ncbi:MAG: glycosyltransferase family 2 protein [Fimbriimonadaceae bacterium]|nr:glycosyltransferase family 2 protein [Fimbriimonadaceae bacterium]
MVAPKRLTIFIPAYNEEAGLPDVLRVLLDRYGADPTVEILVVDDGSSDATAARVAEFAGVVLIRHGHNKGNGAAVKTALRHAQGEVLAIIDADGQHPPELMEALVAEVADWDLVVGARTADSDSSPFRDFGNLVMARVASYLVRTPIPDLTSGFRVFRTALMRRYLHLFPNGFSFPSTSTLCFLADGHSVLFHPIVAKRRETGKSSIRPFRDGAKFLGIIFRLVMLFNPSRVFLPASGLLVLLGLAYGLVSHLVHHAGLSVAALLLVQAGFMLAAVGVLAEQISQLRRQLAAATAPAVVPGEER